jgi:hypothetical protein
MTGALPPGGVRAPIILEEDTAGSSVAVDPTEGVAGEYGTWTVTYHVGRKGIRRHVESAFNCSIPGIQGFAIPAIVSSPRTPAGRITSPRGVHARASSSKPGLRRNIRPGRYWSSRLATGWMGVVKGELKEGDTLSVIHGDVSGGSEGVRTSIIRTHQEPILLSVDSSGTGEFRMHPRSPNHNLARRSSGRADALGTRQRWSSANKLISGWTLSTSTPILRHSMAKWSKASPRAARRCPQRFNCSPRTVG